MEKGQHFELFKIFSERKSVCKGEALFKETGKKPDKGAIEQRAEQCSDADSFKLPQSEKGEGEDDGKKETQTVINSFGFADIKMKLSGNFFDDQFIGFG